MRSPHGAEKKRANVCACVCVCVRVRVRVCATCVGSRVCRVSASLRACMWSLVRNRVCTPCLERIKKEKKKSLIGVAPGIITSTNIVEIEFLH